MSDLSFRISRPDCRVNTDSFSSVMKTDIAQPLSRRLITSKAITYVMTAYIDSHRGLAFRSKWKRLIAMFDVLPVIRNFSLVLLVIRI